MIKSSDLPMYDPKKKEGPLGVQAPKSKALDKEPYADKIEKKEKSSVPCVQGACDSMSRSALPEAAMTSKVGGNVASSGNKSNVLKSDFARVEPADAIEVSYYSQSDGLFGVSSFPDLTRELRMQKRLAPNLLPVLMETAIAITSQDEFSAAKLKKDVNELLDFHGRFMTIKSEQLCRQICEHAVARVEEYEVGRRNYGDNSSRARNQASTALNIAVVVIGRECALDEIYDELKGMISSLAAPNPKITQKIRAAVGREIAAEISRGFRAGSLTEDNLVAAMIKGFAKIPGLRPASDDVINAARKSMECIVTSLAKFTPQRADSR